MIPRRWSVRPGSCFSAVLLAAATVPALAGIAVHPPREALDLVRSSRPEPAEIERRLARGDSLLLEAAVFDPLADPLPAFAAGRPVLGTEGTFLVQFRTDLGAAGRLELERAGVSFVDRVPSRAWVVRAAPEAFARLAAHPDLRWLDAFRGGYKLASILRSPAWTEDLYLELRLLPGESAPALYERLRSLDGDVHLAALHGRAERGATLRVLVPAGHLHPFAGLAAEDAAVWTVSPWFLPQVRNDDSIWVEQSFDTTNKTNYALSATLWNHGITGAGQFPGLSDTGIDDDMCFFRDSNAPSEVTGAQSPALPETGAIDPTKKVAAYYVLPGATPYDGNTPCNGIPESYHGTHTAGTVAGDNYATPSSPLAGGHDPGDGMAPNARIIFQDAGNEGSGCLEGLANDFRLIAQQAYDAGVRVHSNSWGSDVGGAYTGFAGQIDEIMHEREDLLFVFSAGNSGSGPNTIGSPATAKSCVTVGATGHAASSSIASFSSRGPTDDGRRKPEIVAPGESVVSASGDTSHTSNNCGTKTLNGTSMAAPTVAGGATLLRQYFTDGFYPSGGKLAADGLGPSAALLKAALVNGAIDIANTSQATMFNTLAPNNNQGFGRIQLDNVAFFATPARDARRTRVWDKWNATGLTGGQQDEYPLQVAAGQPLKVALVWTDPPPSPIGLTQLVNDLDLEVVDPVGTVYRGNVLSAGQSTPGGAADALNPTEIVFLKAPAAGVWTLRVKGSSIPGVPTVPYSDRQGYALVATYGDCTNVPFATLGLAAADQADAGIALTWSAALGATHYQIYRAEGNCSAPATAFHYLGQSATPSFTDTLVQGGLTYAYKVRGATACNEGPLTTCVSATSTGNCTLHPSFGGLASALNDTSTGVCDSLLAWDAGASNCPAAPGVTYDVYRSGTPYFTPGPATLIGGGTPGTSYADTAVVPNTAYFYIVRAEDSTTQNAGPGNGGNLDLNTLVRSVTPTSAASYPGTWLDDVDGAARVAYQPPWRASNLQNHTTGGTLAYHSAPDGQTYPPSVCAELATPPIPLQSGAPALTYWVRYDLEALWDGVVVEISTNDGNTWNDLPPAGGYPSSFASTGNPPINACGYAASHGAFSGTAAQWTPYSTSLAAYAGQTVRLRFRLSTDPGVELDGLWIDDIAVTGAFAPASCGADLRLAGAPAAADSCAGAPGDGVIEAGEDVALPVSLQNIGDTAATAVAGTLSTSAPGVVITRPVAAFPALGSGATGGSAPPHFGLWVAPAVPCGTSLPFTIELDSAQGGFTHTLNLTVGSGAPCSQTVCAAALPVEDGPAENPLLVAKAGAGGALDLTFGASCHATDATVYWGEAAGSLGGLDWTHAACGFGPEGAATVDPGTPTADGWYYLVVVPGNGTQEGSYGRDSAGAERPAAAGLGPCNLPQQLGGSCP